MLSRLASRCVLAIVTGSAVMALAGTAAATGSTTKTRVSVTCPAGHDPSSATHEYTAFQLRNVTGLSHVLYVRSVKVYSSTGALLKNMPSPDAFPPGFVRDVPAHGATAFSTTDLFGTQEVFLTSVVFNIEVTPRTYPFSIMAVNLDIGPNNAVVSRNSEACVERWE